MIFFSFNRFDQLIPKLVTLTFSLHYEPLKQQLDLKIRAHCRISIFLQTALYCTLRDTLSKDLNTSLLRYYSDQIIKLSYRHP